MKHSDFSAYRDLAAAFSDEVVTHSRVEDVQLPQGAGTFALIRLDNDSPKRPSTLGPNSLIEFGETVAAQAERARAGEIVGLGVIGKPGFLVAGADLGAVNRIDSKDQARAMADLGHHAYELLEDFPVPTFAFINGTALGGGLEIALAAHYRTVSEEAKALSLPEAFLGLVPGWGGVYRLPKIIGPEAAAQVIFTNALNNNKTLKGAQAYALGIADALFGADTFLEESLTFAAQVISQDSAAIGALTAHRERDHSEAAWERGLAAAQKAVASKTGDSAPAPKRALELFEAGRRRSRAEERQEEVAALGDLMVTDEFANTVYAFLELVQKRAKRPAGVPEVQPRPLKKIGVVGAGLMASQLAMVFAQKLQVPVVISDIDQARVDKGVDYIRGQAKKLAEKGRISVEQAEGLSSLVTGSVDKSVYADADFIIEAVFEEIGVKKQVFAELEEIVSPEAILATNTSSLSVTEMAADLKHPDRVIGFHFFNPVAVMPLIEIARTPQTADEPIATAFQLAAALRKTPVLSRDSTAFVVNRVLLRLMAEVQKAFDEGTDAKTADGALAPIGLPMSPFTLLAMVGIPVAQHVTESLHTSFGDRFYVSANLQRLIDNGVTEIWSRQEDGSVTITESTRELLSQGQTQRTADEILTTVQDALAEEIGLLLDEGVVASPKDVDLCMILGAGWPMHRGGITPYLDQCGASDRVNGRRFDAAV
ncbi:3-hydroxyacyl-CoA dehydrogenase NAD-binding domain-containing protein [Nesterenkonia lacusekhoensis]|uniref:3-hydroxyacyl-CoA dehydrogenase/enoyl-CoA hydratase/carnithine racemase n=1 Tax=Nesterenkonia lacusekhoensis TaxID=150832 RepID=A0ABS4T0M0_9MICC|nr:3-hydroxyacyl-CoA dehydrogenase NAD-binding domain-containing protein [Nesterenkonia lacusekhoensis]MBP2318003.1 3-hydroxyacyl-CoA dehydrogenase/enoyl-CoA hydratase/carnithine racemase [Nesterenkonia lacusekhoensis]